MFFHLHNRNKKEFRCGILPIRVEISTGRFRIEHLHERVCIFCENNCIEDEEHFLVKCPLYSNLRKKYFHMFCSCLLYTSDAADDMQCVDLGGRRIIKKSSGLVRRSSHYVTSVLPRRCFGIFSSRRRHTRCREVSWARRCV